MSRASLLFALALALGACAVDEDATGTENPDVVTPAETPPALGAGPDADADSLPPDSATSVPALPE